MVQWIGVLENLKTTSIWIASTSPPWQEPCVCVMNPPLKNMNEQAGIEYQWMSWINFWVIFVKDQLSPTCNISGRPGQAGAERELLGSQIFPVVHQGSLWILGGYWGWRGSGKVKVLLSYLDKSITPYLIFVIFLHEQNFWSIKFTPKKRANYDKIHRKLPIFCVITAKYAVNCQFFALNL